MYATATSASLGIFLGIVVVLLNCWLSSKYPKGRDQ